MKKISNARSGFMCRVCVVRRRGVPPCSEYVGFVFGRGYAVCGIGPKRGSRNDGFYAAVACGWFSLELDKVQQATYETTIEITYVIQLNRHISIQPDFQYVMHPYGNTEIGNALVVGGQLLVTF